MPGMKLLTNHDPQACLKIAWRSAQELGYALTPTPLPDGAKSFVARKGNVLLSLLAGGFSPHCDFRVWVESFSDANEVGLEFNAPWLSTGTMGVKNVRVRADQLLSAIAAAIEKTGAAVMERKEF